MEGEKLFKALERGSAPVLGLDLDGIVLSVNRKGELKKK